MRLRIEGFCCAEKGRQVPKGRKASNGDSVCCVIMVLLLNCLVGASKLVLNDLTEKRHAAERGRTRGESSHTPRVRRCNTLKKVWRYMTEPWWRKKERKDVDRGSGQKNFLLPKEVWEEIAFGRTSTGRVLLRRPQEFIYVWLLSDSQWAAANGGQPV